MNTRRCISRRLVWFVLASFAWAVLATSFSTGPSLAQEKDKEKPAAEAKPGEAKAEAKAGEGGAGGGGGETKSKSFFLWIVETSGLIGAFIFILSIYFVATVSRMFWELRIPMAIPPDLVGQVDEQLQSRDFKNIFALVKEDDSFLARALSTGISELPNGLAEARDSMERVGEAITAEMEKKISILAVLGTLGPMIGLLGTLKGMIASFSVIAMSDVQLKASAVAGGISEALVLTFEGVALSVPSIYFFSLFKNRVTHISTQTMLQADQFLRHFAHAARGKGGAAPAGPASPATKTVK
jgi:biopolymer transport protein ExbB